MIKKLSPLCGDIEVNEAGGDHDTDNLILTAHGSKEGNNIYLCGYSEHPYKVGLDKRNKIEVDGVELTDCSNTDVPTCTMYGKVYDLLKNEGWNIVDDLEDYIF